MRLRLEAAAAQMQLTVFSDSCWAAAEAAACGLLLGRAQCAAKPSLRPRARNGPMGGPAAGT